MQKANTVLVLSCALRACSLYTGDQHTLVKVYLQGSQAHGCCSSFSLRSPWGQAAGEKEIRGPPHPALRASWPCGFQNFLQEAEGAEIEAHRKAVVPFTPKRKGSGGGGSGRKLGGGKQREAEGGAEEGEPGVLGYLSCNPVYSSPEFPEES